MHFCVRERVTCEMAVCPGWDSLCVLCSPSRGQHCTRAAARAQGVGGKCRFNPRADPVQPLPLILSAARNPRAALSQVSERQVSPSHLLPTALLLCPVF